MVDYKKDDLLFFLHLPKSAGTTLNSILEKIYPQKQIFSIAKEVRRKFGSNWVNEATSTRENVAFDVFKGMTDRQLNSLKIVKGHMGFGWHEKVKKNVSYFTFVRQPIDRIVSQYYYIKRIKGHALQKQIESQNLDLRAFVERGISLVADNGMTRKIAGISDEIPFQSYGKEILDKAKDNIENHFSSIGLSEYFDESIVLMQAKYEWTRPYYIKQNVTDGRKKVTEINSSTLKIIEHFNALDMELYDYIKKIFRNQIEHFGDQFDSSVKKYKSCNAKYSGVYGTLKKIKKAIS